MEIVLKNNEMPKLSELKKGDIIRCGRPSRVVDVMMMLNVNGINNDFLYEYEGKKGVWIEIK